MAYLYNLKTYLLGTLLLSNAFLFSQVPFLIDEEFNAGIATAGWVFSGSIANNVTAQNSGKSLNSIYFQAANDQAISPAFANGDQVTFMLRSNGAPNASDFIRVEVLNGSWSVLANVRPHTTGIVVCLNISPAVTQVRLTYAKGATFGVYFDDFTVRQSNSCTGSAPYITYIDADACGAVCEGRDEFFTFRNGNTPFAISNIEFSYPDASTMSITWCGLSANSPCDNYIGTNPAQVSTLNTLAGCTIFLNPGATIPANAEVMIFNGNPQNSTTTFTALCSSGKQYYTLFANNTTDCNGRFGNYNPASTDPYRGFFLRNRGNGCSDTNSYNLMQLGNYDGASIGYAAPGSGPTYISPGAALACSFIALPIEFVSFYAVTTDVNILYWETMNDKDITKYKIQRSANGTDFSDVGTIDSYQSSGRVKYQYTETRGINSDGYYRLKAVNEDGTETFSKLIFVLKLNSKPFSVSQVGDDVIIELIGNANAETSSIDIYNANGQKIFKDKFNGSTYSFSKEGMSPQLCFINLVSGSSTYKQRFYIK